MAAMTPVSPSQAIKYEQYDEEKPITTRGFEDKSDINDGVSGRRKIDSSYENVDYELLKGGVNEYEGGGAFATDAERRHEAAEGEDE